MADFYISSTKFSIAERKTKKHGTVYDAVFRVITPDGEEKQKKLSGYPTKAAAKKAHAEFVSEHCEVMKGKRPTKKEARQKAEQQTVGELIQLYIASIANQNKESSIYDKKQCYDRHIIPKYGQCTPDVFTKEELYRWQDELWAMRNPRTGEFYSYKHLSKVRSHLSSFLAWLESRYGYVNNMPSVQRPRRKTPQTKMKIWTREQFDQFIAVVDDPMYKCLFTLMFYTGRRKSELFALQPEDVRLGEDKSFLRIDKQISRKTLDGAAYKITATKAAKEQTVPICSVAANALKAYEIQKPFVFGGERPLPENTVTRVFQRYCKKAGLEPIRIHDMRHSFVSMLIHYGANFAVVADLISDTLEQVTKTYAHMYEEDKQAVLAKIF